MLTTGVIILCIILLAIIISIGVFAVSQFNSNGSLKKSKRRFRNDQGYIMNDFYKTSSYIIRETIRHFFGGK